MASRLNRTWFGATLSPQESDRRPDDGITLGLWRLADLGVLTRFGDHDPSFGLSPNLRESLRAYADAEPKLPDAVPARDHESRFSLIRERIFQENFDVLNELNSLFNNILNSGLAEPRDSTLLANTIFYKKSRCGSFIFLRRRSLFVMN